MCEVWVHKDNPKWLSPWKRSDQWSWGILATDNCRSCRYWGSVTAWGAGAGQQDQTQSVSQSLSVYRECRSKSRTLPIHVSDTECNLLGWFIPGSRTHRGKGVQYSGFKGQRAVSLQCIRTKSSVCTDPDCSVHIPILQFVTLHIALCTTIYWIL